MDATFWNSPVGIALGASAGILIGTAPCLLLSWWLARRDHRRWQRERELQRQLWDLEQQIREESLPEDEREWRRRYREQQAEIKREARRRLGLPDEEDA